MAKISPAKWRQRRDQVWSRSSLGPTNAIRELRELKTDIDAARVADEMSADLWMELAFGCSSLMINLGSNKPDSSAVEDGVAYAREVLKCGPDPRWRSQVCYNIGNGLLELHNIDRLAERESDTPPAARNLIALRQKERLRESRQLLQVAGRDPLGPSGSRAAALCNLANALDESGRWIEAYQLYRDALIEDPTNGNAAGNAAELLRRRLVRGQGLLGHYAAVYDSLLAQAKALRARTIEIAGKQTADRWDALKPSGSQGHLAHGGDPLDPYQEWIVHHRLALSLAVDGLGSDSSRFDSAQADSVTVLPGAPDPPVIFTSLNVLKGEYLVARRLAFEGEQRLREAEFGQHESDSGVYADTLDYSLYGEPAAMLVLAQRSTLDLLDKIAVAANDHFGVGLSPKNVAFRGFWCDYGTNKIRKNLPVAGTGPSAILALAELSFDMGDGGMYPHAKLLRDAGTHRLVRVTHDEPTGVTDEAHSSVGVDELIAAAHESLHVARAAYMYLIDLIADLEESRSKGVTMAFDLPNQL